MIQLLHYTRETFFALTAFVLCYTQHGKPLQPKRFWARRYALVLPAYLFWNVLYTIASALSDRQGAGSFTENLLENVGSGYWHLYFVFVMMQLYLLFPLLWSLVRKTEGHHLLLLAGSLVLELAVMAYLRYDWPSGGAFHYLREMCRSNRFLLPYVGCIIAGALAAVHIEQFHGWVRRHATLVGVLVTGAAAVTLAVYFQRLGDGAAPGTAAAIFQPVMVLWNLAVMVGLYLLGVLWSERATARRRALVRWGSDISFGVYLAHPMVLFYVLPALRLSQGPRSIGQPWDTLFSLALTLGLATAFSALAQHTPVSKLLTGRARRSIPTYQPRDQPEHQPTG
jgi:peptidoglycan/LPS O-acetylase OafA/YrhL